MVVGVVGARLFIRLSRSLKEKRRVLNSIKEKLRSRFNVAVSEVDHLDEHQAAGIAIVTVGSERSVVERTIQNVRIFLEKTPNVSLSAFECDYY